MSRPTGAADGTTQTDPVAEERIQIRAAAAKFLLMGFLALLVVGTPVVFWIRAAAERHALDSAVVLTQRVADLAIRPLVDEALLAGDPVALAALDHALEPWRKDAAVLRIKVWSADGRVVYSDLRSLVGQRFDLPEWGRALLAGGGPGQLPWKASRIWRMSTSQPRESWWRSMSARRPRTVPG